MPPVASRPRPRTRRCARWWRRRAWRHSSPRRSPHVQTTCQDQPANARASRAVHACLLPQSDGRKILPEHGLGDACDLDDDGDGVPDTGDACADENSSGFDADSDGCINRITDLGAFLDTLLADGAIDSTMYRSLDSKIEAALAGAAADQVCKAVNQLDALKNEIEAQTGKKISEAAALVLPEFITYPQTYMLEMTGVASC